MDPLCNRRGALGAMGAALLAMPALSGTALGGTQSAATLLPSEVYP